MALNETFNETAICNMSLDKLGATKIGNVETDTSVPGVKCRLHYEQTRDALERSHFWRFAAARAELDETTTPDFEWDNAFDLPGDFLAFRSVYDNVLVDNTRRSYAIEGLTFLTNDSSVDLRYTKKVTDVAQFDPLFIEVLVLQLALKLTSLAGANPKIRASLKDDLKLLMPSVRALDRQEGRGKGRADQFTWTDVRATRGGRIDSRLGSG